MGDAAEQSLALSGSPIGRQSRRSRHPGRRSRRLRPHVSTHCQPYARAGSHVTGAEVYLPAEARFDVDVTDADVAGLLDSNENVHLWHPSSGLIGFEPGDRRCVADLLEAPLEQATAWDRAEPGVAFSRRLTAIEPDATLSADQALDEGHEDIGSRSSLLDELPPRPGEPSASLLARMLAAVAGKLSQMLPRRGTHRERSGGEEQTPGQGTDQASAAQGLRIATCRTDHIGGTRVRRRSGRH